MDVSLTPDLERRVAEKVEAGLYESPSAMVREGLHLLFKAEEERSGARRQMDAMIQVGLDQIDRGETVEWTVARDRILSSLNTVAR